MLNSSCTALQLHLQKCTSVMTSMFCVAFKVSKLPPFMTDIEKKHTCRFLELSAATSQKQIVILHPRSVFQHLHRCWVMKKRSRFTPFFRRFIECLQMHLNTQWSEHFALWAPQTVSLCLVLSRPFPVSFLYVCLLFLLSLCPSLSLSPSLLNWHVKLIHWKRENEERTKKERAQNGVHYERWAHSFKTPVFVALFTYLIDNYSRISGCVIQPTSYVGDLWMLAQNFDWGADLERRRLEEEKGQLLLEKT